MSPASDRPGQGSGESEQVPGRAARRRARRLPPPLPQRDGLDAVRWQAPPGTPPGAAALEALRERFPALADPAATALRERFDAGEIVDRTGRAWSADDPLRAPDHSDPIGGVLADGEELERLDDEGLVAAA